MTTRGGMNETVVLEMGNKEHYMKKKKEFLVVSHHLPLADLEICSSSSEARVPNKNGLMPKPSTLTHAEWHHQSPLLSYHHQASFKPSFPSP